MEGPGAFAALLQPAADLRHIFFSAHSRRRYLRKTVLKYSRIAGAAPPGRSVQRQLAVFHQRSSAF